MRRRTFIQTMMIGTGSVIIGGNYAEASKNESIRVRMIYNNIGLGSKLSTEWGLSMLIESHEETVLFDTGGDAEVLLENMKKLAVDINKISKVVISHNHWDHVNGLPAIIDERSSKPKLYVPAYELDNLKEKFPAADYVGVEEPMQLNENIWTTGQLTSNYRDKPLYEQSIIVVYNEDAYLFTGCSHPGIVQIVERTIELFPDKTLKLAAGGFHLNRHSAEQVIEISGRLKELNVKKIAPSHCTGDEALKIFKKEWKDDFIDFDLARNEVSV